MIIEFILHIIYWLVVLFFVIIFAIIIYLGLKRTYIWIKDRLNNIFRPQYKNSNYLVRKYALLKSYDLNVLKDISLNDKCSEIKDLAKERISYLTSDDNASKLTDNPINDRNIEKHDLNDLEKGIRFKLTLFIKYNVNFIKHYDNLVFRKNYLKKQAIYNLNDAEDTLKFCDDMLKDLSKNIDKDRFYYIYLQKADALFELEKYHEAYEYYRIAIDNVFSISYKFTKFKLKSKHYEKFLNEYENIIVSLIELGLFREIDYYEELNVFSKPKYFSSYESWGDFYKSVGEIGLSRKYYTKCLNKINNRVIIRLRDYDPYTDGALEEEYNAEIKKQEDDINRINSKMI